MFQLPAGFRLLVGRDLEERERLYDVVLAAGRWSVAIVLVLGLAGSVGDTRPDRDPGCRLAGARRRPAHDDLHHAACRRVSHGRDHP